MLLISVGRDYLEVTVPKHINCA